MAVDTSLLISGAGIDHRSMGQHGAPLVRDVENITVTFLTLLIFKGGIGGLARLVMVIFIHGEMDDDIFYAVECF